MRILISAVGTRGDVQPALALALAIRDLGHTPRLAIPPNFTDWAERLGLEARPVGIPMRPPEPGARAAPVPDLIADQFDRVGAAAEGCDLLVGCGAHQYALRSIGEQRGLDVVQAVYAPVSLPARDLAPPSAVAALDEPPPIEELWAHYRRGWNDRALARVNANRHRLGLAPIDQVLDHILGEAPWLAADPVLGPAPATSLGVVQPGAFVMPDATPLPAEVDRFLEAGEPPVYVGLGSMPAAPEAAAALVAAARGCGRRVILSRGWAGLEPPGDDGEVLAVGDLNHQALFGRVAAVVHHGGAGTTTAAALAGAPQVITPMFSDQFYWGRRVEALGLGVARPAGDPSARVLAEALDQALTPAVAERAAALAGAISTEGAAVAARRLIESSE